MADPKNAKLFVNLGASQARRRLKGFGHGVRKVETAGNNHAVIIHTATGQHLRHAAREVAGLIPVRARMSDALGIQAGEQRRSRRAAHGIVVELREPQPARRQRIQVRRWNLATETAEVRPAQIVRKNQDDIGARIGVRRLSQADGQQGNDDEQYRPTRSHDALTDGQKSFQATRTFWLDCRRFRQRSRSLIVQHGQKAGLATYSVCFFR